MQSLSTWAASVGVRLDSAEADQRLTAAYQRVFSVGADREDVEIVLVDLAVYSRFYQSASPAADLGAVHHIEGRRSVMASITGFIADPRILGELQVAALREAIVTETSSRTRKPR